MNALEIIKARGIDSMSLSELKKEAEEIEKEISNEQIFALGSSNDEYIMHINNCSNLRTVLECIRSCLVDTNKWIK